MSSLPFDWTTSLGEVLSSDVDGVARVLGPRHWWGGPLDVEGLALSSTRVAATALHDLTGRALDITAERVAASFASLDNLRVNGRQPQGFAPMSGFWRTADGWVRLHANYPHHAKALKDFLEVTNDLDVREALATREMLDIEARITAAGGVAAAVRSHEEWHATPMGSVASSGPWIRFMEKSARQIASGTQWRMPHDRGDAPLRGLRILDFTRVIAGPSASRLLGALGADVLRIDPPQHPELLDQHIDTGFCKRSVELDLNISANFIKVRELLQECHVVLLGYRPGALDKFGITPQTLTDTWPELKVVCLNAWGSEGPWHRKPGFDSVVQAACGIADIYLKADGSPGSLPVQALDHATGMGIVAAVAILLSSSRYAWAQTSLARTAHELLKLPATHSSEKELELPTRQAKTSTYGTLDYAPPSLLLDGKGVEYAQLPVAYGSSRPQWVAI